MAPDPHSRAEASLEAGRVFLARGRYQDSLRTFERGLDHISGEGSPLESQLRASAAVAGLVGDGDGSPPVLQPPGTPPDAETTAGRLTLARLACDRAFEGAPHEDVVSSPGPPWAAERCSTTRPPTASAITWP